MGNRTDTALLRSLRDGRRRAVAIRILELHEDEGFGAPDNPYPTLPKAEAYRRADPSTRRR